ncbi:MAG TPA: VOC family protein [Gammaproteobacteria bacterium]|nr:VOC family protein [Gammaproteobacteria bacterium]
MIRVLALNHVSLLVQDTERALQFYHGLLGLAIDTSRPDLGFPGAFLDAGNAQIHLLELAAPSAQDTGGKHGGRDRHVALDVQDLEAVIRALETAGIAYTVSRSGRRALFCRDPDGNAVELVERSA